MTEAIATRRQAMLEVARRGLSPIEMAERYCLIGPSFVSSVYEEQMIQIIKEVAAFFSVSPRSMQLCGSAKLGFSTMKKTEFIAGRSDLDIAILDSGCFCKYLEVVAKETDDLQNATLFADSDALRRYKSLLTRGIIRSEILPSIREKVDWDRFFNDLSIRNSSIFSKISAALYLSDQSFVRKQAAAFRPILDEAFIS